MFLWLTAAALAADPAIHVTWRGDDGRLLVRAPTGEHVAPDAPFDVTLGIGTRSVILSGLGSDLGRGVPIGAVRGLDLQGTVNVSLCEDGGSRCRMAEVSVEGTVDTRRRGTTTLLAGPTIVGNEDGFPAQVNASAVYEAAITVAKARQQPVLLDFGAVWCPPCQLMDVEVFRSLPRASVVDAYVLARLDVDDPTSWDLKDQYAIGGYPTLVAVDVAGKELGRQVGYHSADETIAWMDAVATGQFLHHTGDPSAADAAAMAWRAIEEGRDAAAVELMKIAVAQPELVSFRLARMHLTPTLEDAVWLSTRAPGRALDWVSDVGAVGETPEGREAILAAIGADLANATPLDAADLLYASAGFARDDAEQRTLYGAAAVLVRSQLSGDPSHDKGHYDWLAVLTERSGQPDQALQILERARDAFPDEPTFHSYLARAYLRQGQPEEALEAIDRALEMAWGDNKLTAAKVKVQALLKLDRRADAVAFVDEILKATPTPAAGLSVRTGRYRAELTALLEP